MLDFRKELSKVIKKGYDERVMDECLKAVLSAFEEIKVIKPLVFHFYSNFFPVLSVVKEGKGRPLIWEKEFENHDEVDKYLLMLKKTFKEQGYYVEEYYGTTTFRVRIEP